MNDKPTPTNDAALEQVPRPEAPVPLEKPKPPFDGEGYRTEILERLDEWPW